MAREDVSRPEFEAYFDSLGLWGAHPNARERDQKGRYVDRLAQRHWLRYKDEHRSRAGHDA